jgi:hypothetical protein
MRLLLAALLAAAAPLHAQDCPKPDSAVQAERETQCRAVGGEWARFGVHAHLCGLYSCAARTTDGGKPCKSHSDCQYLCVSGKPAAIGAEVVGQCAAIVSSFGCTTHVGDGKVAGTICVE